MHYHHAGGKDVNHGVNEILELIKNVVNKQIKEELDKEK
jgi:hypothetical protein